MKAVSLLNGALTLETVPEPKPAKGQVLVRTLACGVCGTDLHAQHHICSFIDTLKRSGQAIGLSGEAPIILGHEYCAEIIDHGPDTDKRFPVGARVVGLPYVVTAQGAEFVGYSNSYPGGLAEFMALTDNFLFEVPNGLASNHAALTEPLAVGLHAANRAGSHENCAVFVVGCGPIGLAVIAVLKARGVGPVVGFDFSAFRREAALALGADQAIDPAVEEPLAVWSRLQSASCARAVIYECVGRPGVLQQIVAWAPSQAIIIGVGNSLEPCSIDQVAAFNKELEIRFSVTYTASEFEATLHDLAEGRIASDKFITGLFKLEDTPAAFEELRRADRHSKILITYGS